MKIELDKYYTPIEVANHCWEIVEKYVEFSTIKRIIEPSVGSGAFCNWKIKPNLMIVRIKENLHLIFIFRNIIYALNLMECNILYLMILILK